MRIGLVATENQVKFGGVQHSVRRIATLLAEVGHAVTVVSIDYTPAPGPRREATEQIQTAPFTLYRLAPAQRQTKPNQVSRDLACFDWLTSFVRRERLDILHAFYISATGFLTGLVAREYGIPFIASVRGNDLNQDLFNQHHFAHIRWTLEHADVLTFVNESQLRRARHLCPISGLTRVIWNSIDPRAFEATKVPEEYTCLPRPIVGTAGRFRQTKGIETLIDACARLARPVTLLLIGDVSPHEREYWESCVRPNVSPYVKVIVTGEVSHQAMLSFHSILDIFVMPSLSDGCPNALLEAMLVGRPVIAADTGAMREIIPQSQAGLLFAVGDADGLALHLRHLIDSPALRASMGRFAHAYALGPLSPIYERDAWLNCYQTALAGTR